MFVVISSAVENPDTIYWKVLLSINYERLGKKTKRQDNYKTKMHAFNIRSPETFIWIQHKLGDVYKCPPTLHKWLVEGLFLRSVRTVRLELHLQDSVVFV